MGFPQLIWQQGGRCLLQNLSSTQSWQLGTSPVWEGPYWHSGCSVHMSWHVQPPSAAPDDKSLCISHTESHLLWGQLRASTALTIVWVLHPHYSVHSSWELCTIRKTKFRPSVYISPELSLKLPNQAIFTIKDLIWIMSCSEQLSKLPLLRTPLVLVVFYIRPL